MGGSTGIYWRGTRVSSDMLDPLDELALRAGDDIYVKPIAGFGSYSDNSNSAGMDAGGGHLDLDLVGLSNEQKLRLERIAREVGFYADIREPSWWSPIRKKTISANWQSHLHMLKKDTTDLSTAARTQLAQWYAGSNGLAGFLWNGEWTYDPDDGPREFLKQTWTQYLQKIEDEMPTAEEIANEIMRRPLRKLSTPDPDDSTTLASAFEWILKHSGAAAANSAKTLSEVTGLVAALKVLATNQGVDPEAILAQVDASVKEALSNLRIVGGDTNDA